MDLASTPAAVDQVLGVADRASLAEVLARSGVLGPARSVAVVRHVASLLDAAHTNHVVRRDVVNPANIVLTGDDVASLVDSGTEQGDAAPENGGDNQLLAYLAPERLTHNAAVSLPTDVYALTCVLFECLTGAPPYPVGDDLTALIAAHTSAPIPRPSRHRSTIPASFDGVIARGMAKNPADRYPSADELARAAQQALSGPVDPVRPPPTASRPHDVPDTLAQPAPAPPPPRRPKPRRQHTPPMVRFLARRLLNYAVLLALASFLTFCLTSLTFHPLESYLQRSPRPPQELIDAKAAQLGLDKPIPVRYAKWVAGAVRGDFGATVTGHPVSAELWRRIGVSLRLVLIGSVVGTVVGVVAGAWGAVRQYRLSDRVITVLSLTIVSVPTFVMADLLILGALRLNMFAGLRVFLYTGEASPISPGGLWDQFVDRVQHIVLPSLTLALAAAASFSRYQRNAMLDVLGEDFIRTARAKGLTRRRALFKHGLRTALIPMATLFAYGVSGLVVGAVFVEKIFGWHGMGEWVVQGIATQDTNVVVAITVFTGAAVLLAGLLSDVIYAILDPRVRVS